MAIMIKDIDNLLNKYWVWLRDKTTLRQVDDVWVEITTPYLDRHNDYIQIYAKKQNGGFLLTDDSETIHDLQLSGCNLDLPKRKQLLNVTLNGFGVKLKNESLEVHTSEKDFALRKHNLLQAILAVNDLFYLATPWVTSLFLEDVTKWIESNDIRHIPKIKFTGKSGFDHLFDFAIPKSKKYPERILKVINNPKKDTAQAMAFAWLDTKDVRDHNSLAYAILNNSEKSIPDSVLDALSSYDVTPVIWSKREDIKEKLAA